MMWVALAAIVVNGATALLFMRGRERDLNIRGAFVHMAADAGVSFGVVVAAVLIHFTGWVRLDPLMGLVIAVVIAASSWSLLRQSLHMAMDGVPEGHGPRRRRSLAAPPARRRHIHDLHIWSLSTTETALTVHLVCPEAVPDDQRTRRCRRRACRALRHRPRDLPGRARRPGAPLRARPRRRHLSRHG